MAQENDTRNTQDEQEEQDQQEERSLEETFKVLEDVISRMEQGDLSLEETFQAYHQGMDLLKSCNDKIDKVEKQVQELDAQGETHEFES